MGAVEDEDGFPAMESSYCSDPKLWARLLVGDAPCSSLWWESSDRSAGKGPRPRQEREKKGKR